MCLDGATLSFFKDLLPPIGPLFHIISKSLSFITIMFLEQPVGSDVWPIHIEIKIPMQNTVVLTWE